MLTARIWKIEKNGLALIFEKEFPGDEIEDAREWVENRVDEDAENRQGSVQVGKDEDAKDIYVNGEWW